MNKSDEEVLQYFIDGRRVGDEMRFNALDVSRCEHRMAKYGFSIHFEQSGRRDGR